MADASNTESESQDRHRARRWLCVCVVDHGYRGHAIAFLPFCLGGRLKRSELYQKVWSMPMTRIANELGISDVGLAKVCRRHAVPAPPRGYWAKKAAGQTPGVTPLPAPELDPNISFQMTDAEERGRIAALREREVRLARERSLKVQAQPAVRIPLELVRPHKLVAETARYAASIPKIISRYERAGARAWQMPSLEHQPSQRFGRYEFLDSDRLAITASLSQIDWILRFHDAFIKAIEAIGMKVAYVAGDRNEGTRVEASMAGESMSFVFTEGYRRERLDANELARLKKEQSWISEWRYSASGKFSLRVSGAVSGAREEWNGTQDDMESSLGNIVQTFLDLVPRQKELRLQQEEARQVAQKAAAAAAEVRERENARAEQLKRAFEMAETYNKMQSLHQFLLVVESRLDGMAEPYAERCRAWLEVVRAELARTGGVDGLLMAALEKPRWGKWPPAWWPQDVDMPNSDAD